MSEVLKLCYLFFPLLGGSLLNGICMKYNLCLFLKRPIDCGSTLWGKPLFGPNKTFRGILAMGIGTALVFELQTDLLHAILSCRELELFDYATVNGWSMGFTLGVFAMLSELPNSFIKRRLNIPSGKPTQGPLELVCYVFDQVDLLLGSWLVLMWFLPVTAERVGLSIVIILIGHQMVSLVGYLLGMRVSVR